MNKSEVGTEMKMKLCGFVLLSVAVCLSSAEDESEESYDYETQPITKRTDTCPKPFVSPDECFSLDEIMDYGTTATSLESLYDQYVHLLTDAHLTIDGDEVG